MIRFIPLALLAASSAIAQQPAATSAVTGERAADHMDKVVCKRFTTTGSLVSAKKICMTKAEWQRQRDETREAMMSSNGCREPGSMGGAC